MNLQLPVNLQSLLNHQTHVKSELARLRRYDEELSKVMPKDFKDWWQGSKEEWPEIAASVIVERRRSEELAWEMLNSKRKDQ
jgi:cephalosporin-C deacetylase-like acetyl esterase